MRYVPALQNNRSELQSIVKCSVSLELEVTGKENLTVSSAEILENAGLAAPEELYLMTRPLCVVIAASFLLEQGLSCIPGGR